MPWDRAAEFFTRCIKIFSKFFVSKNIEIFRNWKEKLQSMKKIGGVFKVCKAKSKFYLFCNFAQIL